MCIGNLIHAVFLCVPVDCAAAEEGTGETGTFILLIRDGAGNIDIDDIVRDIQRLHKCPDAFRIEWCRLSRSCVGEHRIDGQRVQLKILMQALPQNGHGIGQKDTVFAAGNADQDAVAVFNHVKFDNSAQ